VVRARAERERQAGPEWAVSGLSATIHFMKRTVLAVLLGWILGAATALTTLAIAGGLYEYHLVVRGDDVERMINQDGWQLDQWIRPQSDLSSPLIILRRPRIW